MQELNSTMETILERRSTRHFSDKPVSREILDTLMEMAVHAPSPLNNQPWRFHIITSRNKIDTLASYVLKRAEAIRDDIVYSAKADYETYLTNATFFKEAQALIVVQLKPMTYDARGHLWGVPDFFSNEISARGDIMCLGAACQNIMLTAQSLGLGSCLMLYPLLANDDVRTLLDIRKPWDIMAYIPIGYRDEIVEVVKPKRRNIDKIVNFVED